MADVTVNITSRVADQVRSALNTRENRDGIGAMSWLFTVWSSRSLQSEDAEAALKAEISRILHPTLVLLVFTWCETELVKNWLSWRLTVEQIPDPLHRKLYSFENSQHTHTNGLNISKLDAYPAIRGLCLLKAQEEGLWDVATDFKDL